ncbi:MAG: tyrosine recombinase [Alistipes sp.]|jgi:integrase/recombinase XerD|nr:tyrosine recombinase [Alistipes sp.]
MADVEKRWEELSRKYRNHIKLEKRLSPSTVESYMRDLGQMAEFIRGGYNVAPRRVTAAMIEAFMASLYELGVEKTTQARVLSGVKSFFNFLLLEEVIESSPAEFIEGPKTGRRLPEVLSTAEIDRVVATFDASTPLGVRNAAMIEAMYSCGLRVSELVGLRLGDLFFDDGFIRVTGKGDKQRLVPVSDVARGRIASYLVLRDAGATTDAVFLNNRGRGLTRVMVFNILRDAATAAGIARTVSPHTLRHSFATHLLEGGASIRQVQDLLGHENITTTEIYTHLDAEHLRRTVDRHHPLSKM